MRVEPAFWDASAIVPLCCQQPPTARVRRLARRRRFVVWWGTVIEARRALRRLLREDALNDAGFQQAAARLDVLRRSWSEVLPVEEVRQHAEAVLDRFDVRAADSFQLGAALVWCGGRPRHRPFICLDERLAAAAKGAGFDVP